MSKSSDFSIDEVFMRRCLELAAEAEGMVAPNPMVGAVLVHDGRIIGEGKHCYYGGPHAEVEAINSVSDKTLLAESTLYVSLEPCCHYGKTPPCTIQILDQGIRHVVVASQDPFASVDGEGIKQLREAGVRVDTGVMEQEARELNRFFYTYHEKKRPYVFFKWAESLDGFIDCFRENCDLPPSQITGETMRVWVHRWRAASQAIMVGTNTVLLDNPSLTVRSWQGKHPLRISFDRQGKLDRHMFIFNSEAPSLVFVPGGCAKRIDYGPHAQVKEINFENAESEALQVLYTMGIQSLMIEGGATLIERFVLRNLWDEAHTLVGNVTLGRGVQAPRLGMQHLSSEALADAKVLYYKNKNQSAH